MALLDDPDPRRPGVRRSASRAVLHIRKGLGLPVVIVGLGGGLAGAAYVAVLHVLQRWMWPTHHGDLATLAILVAVGAAIAVIIRIGGDAGNVELLVDNIHVLGGAEDVRRTIPLVPASLLGIAAGGAAGPEAPLVQTTGTLGTWVATRTRRSPTDVRVMTITGMAAGFTVLFGAPLGAALFALEILHRRGLQYYEALIPALVGSLCGYGTYVAVTGAGLEPVWRFPTVPSVHGADLVAAVGVGLAAGVGAVLFGLATRVARRAFELVPALVRPAVGGLTLGLLAFWSPFALTYGEAQLGGLLTTKLAVGALVVAVLAKLAGTSVTLGSGWKGGFIIPLFFIGAALGQLLHHALPGVSESLLMATMMAALCTGVTKTPLGSTLVVTEMAGLPLLPATLIAALIAFGVTKPFAMIDSQRPRTELGAGSEPTPQDGEDR
jgi:H+/Cl- antiporter ClcA